MANEVNSQIDVGHCAPARNVAGFDRDQVGFSGQHLQGFARGPNDVRRLTRMIIPTSAAPLLSSKVTLSPSRSSTSLR